MKPISKSGNSLEELLKKVTDENIHSEMSTLNEDEFLITLSKAPGTESILSKPEKAKYLKRINKLIRELDKKPLEFKYTAQEIRDLNRK
jgi:hypothetical protein